MIEYFFEPLLFKRITADSFVILFVKPYNIKFVCKTIQYKKTSSKLDIECKIIVQEVLCQKFLSLLISLLIWFFLALYFSFKSRMY